MAKELASIERLAAACRSELDLAAHKPWHQDWLNRLESHLLQVRDATRETFQTEAFQRHLWNVEAISATGMGRVNVEPIIRLPAAAALLWEIRETAAPVDPAARAAFAQDAWERLEQLVEQHLDRSPRLKMYRVLAALQPTLFTTITHVQKIRELANAMGLASGEHPARLHVQILDLLAAALGPAGEPYSRAQIVRMTLPWLLYSRYVHEQGEEATETVGDKSGAEKLKPLPPERRRRGLLAIRGYLPAIRSMLEFAREGCKREDFRDHMRTVNPMLKPASASTNINALIAEWGVLRATGDDLFLTPRGEALLETGEAEEVSDWLLTRILGFDNLLMLLKQHRLPARDVIAEIKKVNPGWTSLFAPTAMLNWVRSMGLARQADDRMIELTERGVVWADRIDWEPGTLKPDAQLLADEQAVEIEALKAASKPSVLRPSLQDIIAAFPPEITFNHKLIARLDAALWSHHRRHFVVLTGLSGAGKTQLARCYAQALWSKDPSQGAKFCTIPVQPGWYDAASLLGYINPMDGDQYVRTAFLDFLLEASQDPDRPYTVILDEMNLSHPEQYMAPLLSAMETGDAIEFHAQGSDVDGVPARIPYPENLLIIGTVNMDETTHGLSDKVLDRAAVIEFWDIDVEQYPGWRKSELGEGQVALIRSVLAELVAALRPARLHFGWRTIGDVLGYVSAAGGGGIIEFKDALDHAIYAKVLPKLRGEDSPRLRHAFEQVKGVLTKASLSESSAKLEELMAELTHAGNARFWR
jgi:hypothetical protein